MFCEKKRPKTWSLLTITTNNYSYNSFKEYLPVKQARPYVTVKVSTRHAQADIEGPLL